MGDVVPFEREEPHQQGKARCIACRHEWEAVAPVGVFWFECPNCSLCKGAMVSPTIRDEDVWTCNCGNELFVFTPKGAYCPNCGAWQVFP